MTSPLRVALIGAGSVGAIRAEVISSHRDLELVVVSDADPMRGAALTRQFGGRFVKEPFSAAREKDIDIVIVSTPPDSHGELSIAAMSAGKHVLCEKPLAHTLSAAREMCRVAEASGVLLKTGFNHRYFPAMAFAHQLLDQGRIGELISVEAYTGHPGGEEFGHDWIVDAEIMGGGSLVDNGIHVLDLIRFFLGDDPVVKVKGYATNLIWPFEGSEDNGYGLFRSASGKVATVHASWTRWRGYRFWVEVLGTRGYVKASYPPMLAEWGEIPEPGMRAKRHWKVFPGYQVKERLRGWRWSIVSSFTQELTLLAQGIRMGQAVPATGEDGLKVLELAHAIYRSSNEGTEISLE